MPAKLSKWDSIIIKAMTVQAFMVTIDRGTAGSEHPLWNAIGVTCVTAMLCFFVVGVDLYHRRGN